MPIPKITYQLPLELDLPDVEDLSADDAHAKSEQARKALEAMFGKSGAAYIAWASSP